MNEHFEFIYKPTFFKKVRFLIEGNQWLSMTESSLVRSIHYQFSLDQISPRPIQHRELALPVAIISAFFWFLAFLNFAGDTISNPDSWSWLFFFGSLAIAGSYITWKQSQESVIFKNAYSGATIFTISGSKKTLLSANSFIETLVNRIESFRIPQEATLSERINYYQKTLNFLLQEDVLLLEEYEAVNSRLLDKYRKGDVVKIVR